MTTNLFLFATFVAAMLLMSYNYTRKKKTILFFGDSITEKGIEPGGFILILKSILKSEGEEDKYDLLGSGVSGNTIEDLYQRLEKDVMSKDIDIVVVYIGLNDVWQEPLERGGRLLNVFKSTYQKIISRILEANKKLVVCTPSVIGEKTDHSNGLDFQLDEISTLVSELAVTNNIKLVDLRTAFINHNLQHNFMNMPYGILTTDGVHLNREGNILVAEEIWKALRNLD